MFKKFVPSECLRSFSQIKSSKQRKIKKNIEEQLAGLIEEGLLDRVYPKGEPMVVAKCKGGDDIEIVVNKTTPWFFHVDTEDGGAYYPTLRTLHQFPDMLPKVQIDKGGIKFVLNGANIMCAGLTSAGGSLPEENLPAGTAVAVYAEGKEHALAVAQCKLSTDDIKKVNAGIGLTSIHYLGDGLWQQPDTGNWKG